MTSLSMRIPGGQAERAPDLVDRNFVAAAPNRCWVADFTHVKAWSATVSRSSWTPSPAGSSAGRRPP